MTRVAIYARYSTDLQKESSIDDQIRLCRERAEREGWTIVNIYTDPAISGAAMMLRPGIQQAIQSGMNHEFDLLIAHALDRLSRDQEDIAAIYKRLKFADVGMYTLTEGEITPLHIGFKGTMNAMFLSDLREKVRSGQRGNIENGKSAGGLPYGYRVVRKGVDRNGDPLRGDREVDPEAAPIIIRIFEEYVAGRSPIAIAKALNAEGVPGPTGTGWTQSTINGNRRRGIGILNNEIYIGKYVWNRQRFIKNPDTGKRVPRFNPEKEWIRNDVPELRIVDQELWDKAKERQRELPDKGNFWNAQRPKYLLSGLIRCGVCGSGCSKSNHNRYGCSAARTKGTCSNRLKIEQSVLEDAVVQALRTHLMDPELCDLFCREYTAHLNRLKQERNAKLAGHHAELAKLERRRKYIVNCIMDGMSGAGFKDEMNAIVDRKEELSRLIEETPEEKVAIHPNMAHRYRQEVNDLVRSLDDDPAHRGTAHELLRRLVDRVELKPDEYGKRLRVNLHGDLAGILSFATKKEHRDDAPEIGVFKLVAEEGFEPPTQGL